MEDMTSIVPSDSMETAGSASTPTGALSYLSGEWVNTRVANVFNQAIDILMSIIDKGLLADGFGPFESPVTDDMLLRMTPDQLEAFLGTIPTLQEKAEVMARVEQLKLPPRIALPQQRATESPARNTKLTLGRPEEYNTTGQS